MKKSTIICTVVALVAFSVGYLVAGGTFEKDAGIKVSYLTDFKINDHTPDYVSVDGASYDGSDIDVVKLECYLLEKVCYETPAFITDSGVSGVMGVVGLKEYTIIENSPSRIVAEFVGSASTHTYTIDISANKVTQKRQDTDGGSQPVVTELRNGTEVLQEYLKKNN